MYMLFIYNALRGSRHEKIVIKERNKVALTLYSHYDGFMDLAIQKVLANLTHPQTGESLAIQPFITHLDIKDGRVTYVLNAPSSLVGKLSEWKVFLDEKLAMIPKVQSVSGVLTHHREEGKKQGHPAKQALDLPNILTFIAVASGKGGVGKSTTAVNLAVALSMMGLKVGLLDADIYGPSLPKLIGTYQRPEVTTDKKMIPIEWNGVKCMSIGFMVPQDTAMVWRGPMIQGAIHQMLRDVVWGNLDIMIIDMPPGTGDAHLTVAQTLPLRGAVIVSTPQDLALIDARRAMNMFEKVNVPILGMIENMSLYLCPHCGHESHIFGHGGARTESEKMGVPFLGEIPLEIEIRQTSDTGLPIAGRADHKIGRFYHSIAESLWGLAQSISP